MHMVSKPVALRVFSAFAALALVASAVGCGGGGDAAPLTKAQFIKQADAICLHSAGRFQTLFNRFMQTTPDPRLPADRPLKQWTEIVETVFAPVKEQELEELRALGAPRGDEQRIEAIFAAIEDGLKEVEEDPTVESDTEEQFEKSSRLARAYGLTVCGA
jgi:hypothetical protein